MKGYSLLAVGNILLSVVQAFSLPGHGHVHVRDNFHLDEALFEKRVESNSFTNDIKKAIKIVQAAQVQQGRANKKRFLNPLKNKHTLRPIDKSTAGRRHPNAWNYTSESVAEAAAAVAEYEAKKTTYIPPEIDIPGLGLHSGAQKRQSSGFWMEGVAHGAVGPGASSGYQVFRNVKDFGAKGDGVTDDTVAINLAISSGDRCGANCGSSTVKPALVYFPSGTYLVSKSIIGYYNTQLVGNAASPPTLRAASSFIGLGVISSNVYIPQQSGAEWYINQNNFLRQVRNFIIDMRSVPNVMQGQDIRPAGIHWQVAQGTSLQNIQIVMSSRADTTHLGIFMENGSGGFMSDITFSGGAIGAYLGNQQFTIRKLTFTGCKTAVEVHWNWLMVFKSFVINNCQLGFNLSSAIGSQGTQSVTLLDSSISNTPVGISSRLTGVNHTALYIENLKLAGVPIAVRDNGATVLNGGSTTIGYWASGNAYSDDGGFKVVTPNTASEISKPDTLRTSSGWFEKSKPQYQDLGAGSFWDVKSRSGAKGNGRSDDTAAINAAISAATAANMITYFPHGTYLVTDTIFVPNGARIVGEAWPQIMASGTKFSDMNNPYVMMKVGNTNDVGTVEMQDLMFTVRGPTAGAVLMEWNIKQSSQGSAALWDCHFRVGGAIGSNLQAGNCPKLTGKVNPNCIAGSILLHVTKSGTGYFENMWAWTADHDLDVITQDQIDVFVGRGVLIESQGPSWLWGTASEHNVLYQYQLNNAKDVFMAAVQTESPYYQGTASGPAQAPAPFGTVTSSIVKRQNAGSRFASDPSFSKCKVDNCASSWGLRMVKSDNTYFHGFGMYSWFKNYDQAGCLPGNTCQYAIASLDGSSANVNFGNAVTVGTQVMVKRSGDFEMFANDNKNGFGSTAVAFTSPNGGTPDLDLSLPQKGSVGDQLSRSRRYFGLFSTSRSFKSSPNDKRFYWEYQEIYENEYVDCDWITSQPAVSHFQNKGSGSGGGLPGTPKKAENIHIFGMKCTFEAPSSGDWLTVQGGGSWGSLKCDGVDDAFSCIKPYQSRPLDNVCDTTFSYFQLVSCAITGLDKVDKRDDFPYLNPKDISVDHFNSYMRQPRNRGDPSFFRPGTLLFYTRRISRAGRVVTNGLSGTARMMAARLGLLTIWEGWPNSQYDENIDIDFYDITGQRFTYLHLIYQAAMLNTWFTEMSRAFARQAQGTAYVMTEDPENIVMEGIWGLTEFRELTAPSNTGLRRIIAVNEQFENPQLIFTREQGEGNPQWNHPIPWTGWTPWQDRDNLHWPPPAGDGEKKRDLTNATILLDLREKLYARQLDLVGSDALISFQWDRNTGNYAEICFEDTTGRPGWVQPSGSCAPYSAVFDPYIIYEKGYADIFGGPPYPGDIN